MVQNKIEKRIMWGDLDSFGIMRIIVHTTL